MRNPVGVVGACLLGACGVAGGVPASALAQAAAPAPQNWSMTLNTEFQYASWSGNRGFPTFNDPRYGNPGGGSQIYIPSALALSGMVLKDLKLDFVARYGYVWSRQTTPGQEGQASTATDSQLSSTLTYSGFNGFQPYVALLLNLPTGSAALFGTSRFARMDPDLVPLASFGEGFNVGPTLGVNIPITPNLLASLSAGYTFRGSFQKEGQIDFITLAQGVDVMKPGDSATVTGSLGYAMGPLAAQGSVSYSWDQPSAMNGFVQYRAGARVTVTGSGSYAWTDRLRTSVNGFWTHAEKLDVLDGGFLNLVPEASNSNSNVVRISGDTTYQFGNGVSAGPTASFLYRDRNGYDSVNFAFVPAKTRVSAGVLAAYAVNNVSLNGRVERVWTREDDNPDKVFGGFLFPGTGFPVISSDGWTFSLGATARF